MADSNAKNTSKTFPQYVAALSVCLGSVAAGMVLGWTSNISSKIQDDQALNDIAVDSETFNWIGSFANLGALIMCFPMGAICDLIGRKWACLSTIVPFMIGWFLIIFSTNTGMIYAGRILTGLGVGAACVGGPIYNNEIAQKEIRGTLGSYYQLLLTVGILLSYIGGAYLDPVQLSIFCAVLPIVFGLVFFFQPETPVYLMKKNKEEEARASLQRLRGAEYDCDEELEEIRKSLEEDSTVKSSFFKIASTPAGKRAMFIAYSLMIFQQLSGVNAVVFYTGEIFESSGSSLDPAIATIIVGAVQVVATFVSSLIVDKFGRKILLLCSIIFMFLSGFVLALFFTLKDRQVVSSETITDLGFIPILCLIVFISMFSLGFGPIPWLIAAELMPPEIKSTACSGAATTNWLLAFLVTRFYGNLKDSIGGDSTFYIFAGISLLGAFFVFFCVPETKGKTVAEVQEMLGGSKVEARSKGADEKGVENAAYQ